MWTQSALQGEDEEVCGPVLVAIGVEMLMTHTGWCSLRHGDRMERERQEQENRGEGGVLRCIPMATCMTHAWRRLVSGKMGSWGILDGIASGETLDISWGFKTALRICKQSQKGHPFDTSLDLFLN